MFSYNKTDNVIAVEIPNQIATGDIMGNPVDIVEDGIREGLGLRSGENIEDYVDKIVTGAKSEATHLLTQIALRNTEHDYDEYQTARDNKNWDVVNNIEEDFRFELLVDVPPINHYAEQLKNDDNRSFESKNERFSQAFKDAIKMRNRNLFDPERESGKLGELEIDRAVIISDGQTSSRSLVDDVMINGTDAVAVAFNDMVDNQPTAQAD